MKRHEQQRAIFVQQIRFLSTVIAELFQVAERSGILRCFGQRKTAKIKSQQNKRFDYRVTTTMKDEANREIKRIAILATFFVLASLGSATAQRAHTDPATATARFLCSGVRRSNAIHPFRPDRCRRYRRIQFRPVPDFSENRVGHTAHQGSVCAILFGIARIFRFPYRQTHHPGLRAVCWPRKPRDN